jgi:hypothetical protein
MISRIITYSLKKKKEAFYVKTITLRIEWNYAGFMQLDSSRLAGSLWREQYWWHYIDTYTSSDIPANFNTYHTTFVADCRNWCHERLFG